MNVSHSSTTDGQAGAPAAEASLQETEGPLGGAVRIRRAFPTVNLLLFLATVGSTLFAGSAFSASAVDARTWGELFYAGVPFAASLLGILVAHEMGHFITARYHKVDASWPYFIPVPIGIGTFGAVIRMRGRIPTRDALIDIGASGPLAGFVVAVPLLIYGITLSPIVEVPAEPNFLFGNLSAIKLLTGWISGQWPWIHEWPMEPQPLLYVLIKHFVFQLAPGQDVMVHPVAYAAVIGLFVTALNLIPVGQLDGGHIAYAIFGRRARTVGRMAFVLLLLMTLFSSVSWLVWLLLVGKFVGTGHPPVDRDHEPLSAGRRVIVGLTVIVFILTLTPISMDVL